MAMAGRVGDAAPPVVKGATKPLTRTYGGPNVIHGENGLGNVPSPIVNVDLSPVRRLAGATAADFMVSTCQANPGQVTIVTLGPLTNLALAVQQGGPKFVQSVKRSIP